MLESSQKSYKELQIKSNENLELEKSFDSISNIPNPIFDVSQKKKVSSENESKTYRLPGFLNIESLLNEFGDLSDKGHSESYIDLKNAILECGDLLDEIQSGSFTWTSENYNAFNRLYEAVSRYVNDHFGARSTDGKRRLDRAVKIKLALNSVSSTVLKAEGIKTTPVKKRTDPDDVSAARDNVKRLIEYYRAYCTRVGNDIIASDEEKIRRRWNVLKSCEQDILTYLESKHGKNLSKDAAFIKAEYYSLRNLMLMRELAKDKNESAAFENSYLTKLNEHENELAKRKIEDRKENLVNEDDVLTKKQIAAISKIDTWVVRNFRNGGYMSMFGSACDRTDIIGRLFSMSRRKRLYIYYLIETNQRTAPSAEGLICSQLEYEPDLSAFKGRMIANKLKFYSRFSGGYVYWNKLTEAISIAEQASPVLTDIQDFLVDEKKKGNELVNNIKLDFEEEDDSKSFIDLEEKDFSKNTIEIDKEIVDFDKIDEIPLDKLGHVEEALQKELIGSSIKAIRFLQRSEKDKKTAPELTKQKIELQNFGATAEAITNKLALIKRTIEEKKANNASKAGTVKDYTSQMSKDIAGLAGVLQVGLGTVVENALTNGIPLPKFDFGALKDGDFDKFITKGGSIDPSAQQIKDMAGAYKGSTQLLKAIGSVVGCYFIAKNTYDNYGSMNRWDVTDNTLDFLTTGTKAVQSFAKFLGVIKECGFVELLSHKNTVAGMGVADCIIAGVKAASHRRNRNYRVKASQLASGKENKDKFTDGMLKLNRKLGWKQKTDTSAAVTTAVASGAVGVLVAMSVISAGTAPLALGIVGAAAFGIGILKRSISSGFSKGMKMALFDNFFKVEEAVRKVKIEWRTKHPGKSLTKDQDERLVNQVRRRISADLGFYSPTHAAKSVAVEYAKYLLDNARETSPDKEMCRNFIQGLGLQFKLDEDDQTILVPKQSDIVKKLCG